MEYCESICVLGHNGLLGQHVVKYFKCLGWNVFTTDSRFPEQSFIDFVQSCDCTIINCINSKESNFDINWILPATILNMGKRLVQPCSDAVFLGDDKVYKKDDHLDGTGEYPESKIGFLNYVKATRPKNLRIIRSSIIGLSGRQHLMDWYLSQKKQVCGYTNIFWSGITALEWAKFCHNLLSNWDLYTTVNQLATDRISKHDLLCSIKEVFGGPDITQAPFECDKFYHLGSDFLLPTIKKQLLQLREFYNNDK